MSLGKLLRQKRKKNKINILEIIDKAITDRSEYSFENVVKSVNKLNNYLESSSDDFDEDVFMSLFFDMFNKVYADKHRKKAVFHPSSLMTECERKLFYELSGYEYSDKVESKITGNTQRTFDLGTWYHTYLQAALWKAGVLKKAEAVVYSRRRKIEGRADGILEIDGEKLLLEIKTSNSFGFSRMRLKPLTKHLYQASIYAKILGIEKICFIYVNKDTSEIVVHVVPVSEELYEEANDKMNLVLRAVKLNKPPERVHCKNKHSTMAKTCPYATLCFKS